MNNRRGIFIRRTSLVNEVPAVREVSERRHARSQFYRAVLANGTREYDTIIGPAAGELTTGELVRVRGCVLFRRDKPVLVVCSVRPVTQQAAS